MKIEDHINHWLMSAEHDFETAEILFQSQKYDWCLFLGHLVLEKALKALYVKSNENKLPPKTHNLIKLAEKTTTSLSSERKFFLDKVNDFNLEVRYPEFRKEFYKTCTREFTEPQFIKIKETFQWLKSQIK